MDSDLKDPHPSKTNWQLKWIDVSKMQIYLNRWPRVRPPWSRKPQKKEPLQTTINPWCGKYWQHKSEGRSTISGLFPEKQKECHKGTRGTGELLYINQHILNESKARWKNLAMTWIDNIKTYDMLLQSWIINCQKMYKTSNKVIKIIEKTMETCRVELFAGGKNPERIFQGVALSTLLFAITMITLNYILRKCTTSGYKLTKLQEKINHLMYMDDIKLFAKNERELETLIQTVRIYSQDIGMEFGIEKCTMLIMKIGKQHMREGIDQPNQEKIRILGEKEM